MSCDTCKHLMTRKRMDGEVERICLLDLRMQRVVIECSEWEEREAKKPEKK